MKVPPWRLFQLSVSCVAIAACIDTKLAPPSSAGLDTQIEVMVYDAREQLADLSAIPRKPRIVVQTPVALDLERSPLLLLRAPLDEDLMKDLERSPLLAAHRERLVECVVDHVAGDSTQVVLMPRAALSASSTYVVAVLGTPRSTSGATLGEGPFALELTVSASTAAGAKLIATWPADASAGVATNLLFAAWIFDGEVTGIERGLWLEDAAGLAVPGVLTRIDCAELDARGTSCFVLEPDGSLEPLATYTLRSSASLMDATGAALEPASARFTSGEGPDFRKPELTQLSCAIDERVLGPACGVIDDRGYSVHMRAGEAVRIRVRGDRATLPEATALLAPSGAAMLARSGLESHPSVTLDLAILDAAGNESARTLTLPLESDLATLSITEVRADPSGPEPAQEFVELINFGEAPVSLAGFSLADAADEAGTRIDSDARVFPSARVLLVADDFDAASPLDVAPAAGAQLVRIGKSLTRGGLLNAGEALFLRDADGRRVSSAPAAPKPRAGTCIERVTDDPRSGATGSFDYAAADACTPGF